MTVTLKKPAASAVPIVCVTRDSLAATAAAALSPAERQWLATVGFAGAPDSHVLLPGAEGHLRAVWAGVRSAGDAYALSALPMALPEGRYRLDDTAGLAIAPAAAAQSWALGGYRFARYKAPRRTPAELQLPAGAEARHGLAVAAAMIATRDLVNTPAEHLGPAELAQAAQALALAHGARFKQTVGDALLKPASRFPAIHAVGRAAAPERAPRLIELSWGSPKHPRLTLVGKGVCFDSGGLDIKPADGMRHMKKDMGGAANALGLAQLIMGARLPVQLTVLIPAVENAIAGNAYRPGDVISTRAGLGIEIGNTDAEGRVILCDALAYAAEARPDLIIDLATLTGAARIALGGQLPALFCRDMAAARDIVDHGLAIGDPLWHLPLWAPYHAGIESDVADIVNTGRGPQAGAINAALFLADFVPASIDWLHIDLYAWNDAARPGRPAGGEAQTIRTLLDWLKARYGG
ncbi:leucyl aminopeptidase family protein [Aquabacterium sp. OR-4]|uniref:leucyl aminopeptidase family protein n=1 Tax=Aquabacterium sp. OR-4 TaxID=2978127 RepID=UPI0021B1D8E5|nr:leucyl aminopeptidase family protein [Aquabacterium sp. OR-4]MDT7834544.1 leucyl aminopeptidase family protein [Aquabacterium sp. OR-4]